MTSYLQIENFKTIDSINIKNVYVYICICIYKLLPALQAKLQCSYSFRIIIKEDNFYCSLHATKIICQRDGETIY